MPQADIGIINSTVFFLFSSFILGYFVWVNYLFPKVLTSIRVKTFTLGIEDKSYNVDVVDDILSKRLELKFSSIFLVDPILSLDLHADELVLLFNTSLVTLFFYFISGKGLSALHKNNSNIILGLSSFDFSEEIRVSILKRKKIKTYLRKALAKSMYTLLRKWQFKREHLLFPSIKSKVLVLSREFLFESLTKRENRRIKKIKRFFKKAKKINLNFKGKSLTIRVKSLITRKKLND